MVAGGCTAAYTCERGTVRIDCGGDDADTGASCDCLVDDVVVATCNTSDDGENSDGAQCMEEDNCCVAALGASQRAR